MDKKYDIETLGIIGKLDLGWSNENLEVLADQVVILKEKGVDNKTISDVMKKTISAAFEQYVT